MTTQPPDPSTTGIGGFPAEVIAQAVDQAARHAIILLDPDGTIRSWNAGAEQVTGHGAAEAIGRHFSMFHPEPDRLAGLPDRLLDDARAIGHVEHTGWRVRKDGERFWGDVVISALRDATGELSGYIEVARDLTAHKLAEEEREASLAILAHDIKTPATALKGFASLVGRLDGADLADVVARIESNADRLCHLVDGLVEHARLRAGRVSVTLAPVALGPFIRAAVDTVGSLLDHHELRIEGGDVVVLADRAALQRVLDNLLTNAAKYSPPGSRLSITTEVHADRARVSVADGGRGIDAADLPRIFDGYERGRMADVDGGAGLGLASVRSLVALQGGNVWIESEPGAGTTVTFDLPVADR